MAGLTAVWLAAQMAVMSVAMTADQMAGLMVDY
jgi:hypothetical protein